MRKCLTAAKKFGDVALRGEFSPQRRGRVLQVEIKCEVTEQD